MSIVLKLIHHNEHDNANKTAVNTDPPACLSTNITRMRNKIKTEIELHPTKVMYINPVRAVIGLNNDNTNERDENEEEEGNKELSELRQTTELRSEKIETELIAIMTKEMNNLKLISHSVDLVHATGNDLKNLNSVHSNTAYMIDDTNPNTHEFLSILNGLCKQFTCVWLVKCSLDDPHTDRFIILTADDVSNINDDDTSNINGMLADDINSINNDANDTLTNNINNDANGMLTNNINNDTSSTTNNINNDTNGMLTNNINNINNDANDTSSTTNNTSSIINVDDTTNNINNDPTNQAALIDFLYTVCATALTIIRLNKNEFRKHIKIVMQTLRNILHQ